MRVPFLRPAMAGILLLALAAPAASASPGVQIVIDNNFTTGVETFTAVGFCPAGLAESSDVRFDGRHSGFSFHLQKTLTCDDGSGTLTISVNAATTAGSLQDQGGWAVVSGTGAYAGANGGGNVVGYYNADGIEDHYTGSLHG